MDQVARARTHLLTRFDTPQTNLSLFSVRSGNPNCPTKTLPRFQSLYSATKLIEEGCLDCFAEVSTSLFFILCALFRPFLLDSQSTEILNERGCWVGFEGWKARAMADDSWGHLLCEWHWRVRWKKEVAWTKFGKRQSLYIYIIMHGVSLCMFQAPNLLANGFGPWSE